MVQERIPMNVVMEMLTLTYQEKLSNRKIALRLGISRLSVQKYQEQAREAGIDEWPLSKDADGGVERLRKALYPEKTVSVLGMPLPDWRQAEKELRSGKKNGVTLRLLWQEYRMEHPDGLSYSRYCAHYKEFRKRDDLRIHLPHAPGEELYIDYSGPKVLITPVTGKPFYASIFVAVMGLSSYTFAYCTNFFRCQSHGVLLCLERGSDVLFLFSHEMNKNMFEQDRIPVLRKGEEILFPLLSPCVFNASAMGFSFVWKGILMFCSCSRMR